MAHLQNEESYKITKKSDIYMLGVLMWEISKSRPPFEPPKEICQLSELTIDMINDARVEFIEKSQMAYIDLYTDCWQDNLQKRPTIQEIVKRLEKSKIPEMNG
ncbi:4078_t:CDS:2, partial [Gigaspora rosea]